jgi:DNA-binding NarL/FixJ family response regulator
VVLRQLTGLSPFQGNDRLGGLTEPGVELERRQTPMERISVIVSFDEEVYRAALVQFLWKEPDLAVLADCSNNREAVELSRIHIPALVLCQCDCERLPVSELTRNLRGLSPEPRALVIAREDQDPEAVLRWGAWGYLLQRSPGETFARAIRVIAGGEYWVGRDVLTALARRALNPTEPAPKEKPLLSAREVEILQLVSAGKTNYEIAEALFVEPNTIRTHLRRIYGKLDVHDRRTAVVAAADRSYLQLPNCWHGRST